MKNFVKMTILIVMCMFVPLFLMHIPVWAGEVGNSAIVTEAAVQTENNPEQQQATSAESAVSNERNGSHSPVKSFMIKAVIIAVSAVVLIFLMRIMHIKTTISIVLCMLVSFIVCLHIGIPKNLIIAASIGATAGLFIFFKLLKVLKVFSSNTRNPGRGNRFCNYCQKPVSINAAVCPYCGRRPYEGDVAKLITAPTDFLGNFFGLIVEVILVFMGSILFGLIIFYIVQFLPLLWKML